MKERHQSLPAKTTKSFFPSKSSPYLIALVLTALLFVVGERGNAFEIEPILILLLIPVAISSFLGGVGPGLFSAALATIGNAYILITSDHGSIHLSQPQLWQWISFPAISLVISLIIGSMRRHTQSVQRSELNFKRLFELSADMLCIAGSDGRFHQVNTAFTQTLGYTEGDLQKKVFIDLVHPEDREATADKIKKLIKGEPSVSIENRYLCGDGTYKWLSWTSTTVPEEGLFFAVARDITEAKKRQLEFNKDFDFSNTVIENVPDMIFVKEAKDLRFVLFNKAGEDLLGYSRDELIGKNDYDLFPKTEADFFVSQDRSVLANKKLLEISEEPIHTRYKGSRTLRTKKFPIYDEKGQPQYLLGISEDITIKKESDAYREQMIKEKLIKEEAQKALTLRDEFISIAAHELKTPLTALKMQVQILNKIAPELEASRSKTFLDLLHNSQEQLDRFSRLIDDLLDVSRASAGRLIIDRHKEDLSEIVNRIANRYESALAKARCTLELQLEPSIVGEWDSIRIEQVILNLLSNAMKYGAGQRIEVSTRKVDSMARLEVRDHGLGIAKKDQIRVFNRFERAVSSKSFGGLGLGLYITRQIVAAHGGRIHVESELGEGSCFIVELPLESEQKQEYPELSQETEVRAP